MSELERQALYNRINGMTFEEKEVVATAIPSHILINELHRRSSDTERKLSEIQSILEGGA